jgi:hypothetical protein
MNNNRSRLAFQEGIRTLQIMFPLLDEEIILAVLAQTGKQIMKVLKASKWKRQLIIY